MLWTRHSVHQQNLLLLQMTWSLQPKGLLEAENLSNVDLQKNIKLGQKQQNGIK